MNRLIEDAGVHVVCDGQYGSTGKGVLAAWLAMVANIERKDFMATVSNAGPNSGHTFYHGDMKIVLKQLPTFAVASHLLGRTHPVFLSAGAVIDPEILRKEASEFPTLPIFVHPNAAVITPEDKQMEHSGSVAAVAGTRSGTGAALARKVLRDPTAVWAHYARYGTYPSIDLKMPPNVMTGTMDDVHPLNRIFMEISQGFSLGLNQQFYPKCTSRECTVAQGLADAGISPRRLTKVYMSIRTFPIRVGNVDGFSSGEWYDDQKEVTWEAIGQKPELTTVTQRVRRVATFSYNQFFDAIRANEPDYVFVNFLNYLTEEQQEEFLESLRRVRNDIRWFELIKGYGPKSSDVRV